MEGVEVPQDALRWRAAGATPGRSQRMRGRHERQPSLDVDSLEGRLDLAPPACAHGCERDDLVAGRLGETDQRAADVVAHAGARMGQRRDVDDDSHAPADGAYWNPFSLSMLFGFWKSPSP